MIGFCLTRRTHLEPINEGLDRGGREGGLGAQTRKSVVDKHFCRRDEMDDIEIRTSTRRDVGPETSDDVALDVYICLLRSEVCDEDNAHLIQADCPAVVEIFNALIKAHDVHQVFFFRN